MEIKEKLKKLKGNYKLIAILSALVVMMLLAISVFFPGSPKEGMIRVPANATMQAVSDSLKAKTGSSFYTKRVTLLLRLFGAEVEKRQGSYRVDKGTSPFSIARRIKSGSQSGIRFTFNNLRTLDEFAQRWGDLYEGTPNDMRRLLKDSVACAKYGKTPQTIVCILIPDTYEFFWDVTPEKTLDRMFEYYNDFWDGKRMRKASKLNLTPDEVTTIASIVEEETSKADERGKVARLYINRYQQGMRLQADPTVKFAIGDFSIKRLTELMLQVNSPYNTYRVNGLPPGPIRLPEKSTIDAVLDAPEHNFMYMCARADFSGYHDFTVDYNSHLENAHRYQEALDARGIK